MNHFTNKDYAEVRDMLDCLINKSDTDNSYLRSFITSCEDEYYGDCVSVVFQIDLGWYNLIQDLKIIRKQDLKYQDFWLCEIVYKDSVEFMRLSAWCEGETPSLNCYRINDSEMGSVEFTNHVEVLKKFREICNLLNETEVEIYEREHGNRNPKICPTGRRSGRS